MEIEHLQVRKEDTEKEIKELHKIAEKIDKLEFEKEIKTEFINRLNKEIEWKEFILSELDTSISYELNGYSYECEAQDEDKIKGVNPADLK